MRFEKIGELARKTLQKKGFDLVRFWSLNTVLAHHGIDLVLDVGANVGQYGSRLREQGYRGRIVSFEPQKQPFAVLAETARRDGNWTAVNIGLGSEAGQKTINVYRDSVFSSMLTLDQGKIAVEPVGTEAIEIRTLDGVIGQYVSGHERTLLKIDTQGFEKQVLAGAEQSLSQMAGVQIEMSLTPLYGGQPRLDEMVALLRDKGFILWQLQRGACNMQTGQQFETDGIFLREKNAKS